MDAAGQEIAFSSRLSQSRAIGWKLLVVGAGFWTLAACLQWRAGAFSAEFGSHPDEAAHYITGLMIRDYVASGNLASPIPYAKQYYLHYPKVAIGAWPPLFHLTEGFWTLLFTPSKSSVLLFEALLTAILATSVCWLLRRSYPLIAALGGGALLILLPLVRRSTQAVMADGLVALLVFWAMVFFIGYLENGHTRDGVFFGVFAALSMSTKVNGVALVLLPVIAFLITGRWYLLRRVGMYYAGAIILLFGVPWQMIAYSFIRRMGVPHTTLGGKLLLAVFFGRELLATFGWGLAPFFLLGILLFIIRLWRTGQSDLTLAGALAVLLSVWVLNSVAGIGDARYMLSAVPVAILFTFSGFDWLIHRVARPRRVQMRSAVLGSAAAVVFLAQFWTVPRKPHWGFDQAARFLLSSPQFRNSNFLVVANACGEGAFVSEVAMHDQRPEHAVFRASKVLSSSTWFGTNYQLLFPTSGSLREFFDRAPISAVVVDRDAKPSGCSPSEAVVELSRAVEQTLSSDPNWKLRGNFPQIAGASGGLVLYSRIGGQPAGKVNLDLRHTLGKSIVYSNIEHQGEEQSWPRGAY